MWGRHGERCRRWQHVNSQTHLQCTHVQSWREHHLRKMIENIPGIDKKTTHYETKGMETALNCTEELNHIWLLIHIRYSRSSTWTHAYIDGSAIS